MSFEIDAEMSALQRRLDAYTASHVQGVRDLAEMVSICTSAHRERLDDQEDPLGIVFRDAVGLYREKHNITETALQSGFPNVSYFIRTFKNTFHVPPLQYRNSIR